MSYHVVHDVPSVWRNLLSSHHCRPLNWFCGILLQITSGSRVEKTRKFPSILNPPAFMHFSSLLVPKTLILFGNTSCLWVADMKFVLQCDILYCILNYFTFLYCTLFYIFHGITIQYGSFVSICISQYELSMKNHSKEFIFIKLMLISAFTNTLLK